MFYPRCTIIGIGLIGGSFALAGKRAGVLGEIMGVARSRATREGARAIGAADAVIDDPVQACAEADLVYLATPVGAIPGLLQQIAGHLKPGCTVTDAGSTKAAIVAAARDFLPPQVTFIGGHPMAGSEHSGIAAARADLFEGQVYFLTPQCDPSAPPLVNLRAALTGIGAQVIECDAERHDERVALTSHLPHLVAAALARTVQACMADDPESGSFLGRGFADTTRIASGPAEVWRDIFLANREYLLGDLDELICRLQAFAAALSETDADSLNTMLEQARRAREELLGG